MARPVQFSRADVVDAAMRVFWRRGYEATSVVDLTTATGLSRSSLYLEFGSKAGLFQAALDAYDERQISSMLADMESGAGGLAAVRGFFEMIAAGARSDRESLARGCLMTNSITELGTAQLDMGERATRYATRLREAFLRCLRQAADDGEISDAALDERAELLATLVLGTWVRAKGEADPAVHGRLAMSVATVLHGW